MFHLSPTQHHPVERDDLARFRWHTGANPRPIGEGETIPVLFRDIGPMAMQQFLTSHLTRLAGPMTPITYLRTADYIEPYTDYGHIGRIVLLQPATLRPWHSGVRNIYISKANRMPEKDTMAFIPSSWTLQKAAAALIDVTNANELREVFGANEYTEQLNKTLASLHQLNSDHQTCEKHAWRLRLAFQTGSSKTKQQLREQLLREGLDEADLCVAWHHLSEARRARMLEIVPQIVGHFA